MPHHDFTRGRLKLFANRSGEQFARKVSTSLSERMQTDVPISHMLTLDFADGESKVIVEESVRGCDVYVVQSCSDPTSSRGVYKNFFELLQAADALRGAGANTVTAVMPYHPFERQDKSSGREPITGKLAATMIMAAGFNNVLCADLHAPQMEGFYDNRVTVIDNLPATSTLLEYVTQNYPTMMDNLVVIAPDAGGAKRSEKVAEKLGARAAQAFKMRDDYTPNTPTSLRVAGLVGGKNILIMDDMVDTAGSVDELVRKLREKEVASTLICCTHALLNGKAIERLAAMGTPLVATDTIPRNPEFLSENPWYHEVSLAPLFAEAIYRINHGLSISELYNGHKG